VLSKCGLSDVEVWSECRQSVVQASSKCGPRVGQVWKLWCNNDEIVKPTSLVALEELFVYVYCRVAPHRIFEYLFVCLLVKF